LKSIEIHPLQFDLETVKYYLHLSELNVKLGEDVKFKNAVKENRRRINNVYEKKANQYKIISDSSQPINLHDGF
jgi:hypothetical protein